MNCPECNSDLIELGTNESHVSTEGWHDSYAYWEHYGYWCKFCEKMYIQKHKSWIEPWIYDSLSETKTEEGEE